MPHLSFLECQEINMFFLIHNTFTHEFLPPSLSLAHLEKGNSLRTIHICTNSYDILNTFSTTLHRIPISWLMLIKALNSSIREKSFGFFIGFLESLWEE